MYPGKCFLSALAGLSILIASSSASAGCKCGVPPAPSAAVGGGSWNMAAPQVMSPGGYAGSAYGGAFAAQNGFAGGANGPYWAPGGYEPRSGSPVYYHDPAGGQYQVTGNPYNDHFGPGFHRDSIYGHYRFPYYNYRAPWYFPGRSVYNRDTNLPW